MNDELISNDSAVQTISMNMIELNSLFGPNNEWILDD